MSTLYVDNLQPNLGGGVLIPGHVVQVVNNSTDQQFTNTTTSFVEFTALATTITPKSSSSKILVTVNLMGGGYNNNVSGGQENTGYFIVCRDTSTNIISQKRYENYQYDGAGSQTRFAISTSFLDSPATTSAVTYRVYGRVDSGVGMQMGQNSDSEVTLMEIAQ